MNKRRKCHYRSAQRACPAPRDYAEQKRSLEAEIACEKAWGGKANPDTDCYGQRDPQDEVHLLPKRALLAEQQGLEFLGANQTTGHGRGDAQLDQQMDEDQSRFHEIRDSRLRKQSRAKNVARVIERTTAQERPRSKHAAEVTLQVVLDLLALHRDT